MKVTIDKMVANGYAPDIKTAYKRAFFQYTRMLGINPTNISPSAHAGSFNMDHAIALGGFSKLIDDLNTYYSGTVPVFELITDMIHDLGNDGLLDGVGAPNGLTAIFSSGAGDLTAAAEAHLISLYGSPLLEPVNITNIDFNQTLFVTANILGPGGSLVFTGPEANLVHGGTLYEASIVLFYYSSNSIEFSISNAGDLHLNPVDTLAPPLPLHTIGIYQYTMSGTTFTSVQIIDNQTIINYLPQLLIRLQDRCRLSVITTHPPIGQPVLY